MHALRLQALQELQTANNIDCVALVPGANLRYFTGLAMHLSERPTVAFVPAEGAAVLVVPELEAPGARSAIQVDVEILTYRDEEGHEHVFHQAAERLGLEGKRIGVEYLGMRLIEMRRIEQSAPGCLLLATEPWMPKLRMCKDEEELRCMRRAVEIAERAMQRFLDNGAIRPGRTELELVADLRMALLQESGHGEAFRPIVAGGPNSGSPHVSPTDRPLELGDLVVIDWGAMFEGYQSDITRTFVLGTPPAQLREMHDAVLAANQSGRVTAGPGRPAQDVDRAARRAITLAGLGEFFIHRTGHGLGLETHEPPYIVEGNLLLLAQGMTFTVEPGVYVPDVGGIRIEDNVVITEDGSETLTTLSRDLIVVE
jgi:Xaa-Pro dipeptidase